LSLFKADTWMKKRIEVRSDGGEKKMINGCGA
jgi:hypothetical protein